ncbi:MAG: hypothetical protein IKR25_07975 [Muribaculaceae bacterium]|nr:hypothetical protein [Muribaculaceae bacterium]
MKYPFICLTALLFCSLTSWAAKPDKAQADSLLHELLLSELPEAQATRSALPPINSQGRKNGMVFTVKGNSLQVDELRNDVYYIATGRQAIPVNSARYPMETMNNLLLGAISGGQRELVVKHHQYGGRAATLMMPMDEFMAKMMPGHTLYCAVTSINTEQIEGFVVFHNPKTNSLHLLQVKAPMNTVTTGTGDIEGDLYSNIPQDNIRNLFGKEGDTQPATAKNTPKRTNKSAQHNTH